MVSAVAAVDFNDICRFCLGSSQPLVNVLDCVSADKNVIQDVRNLFNVHITSDEGLPSMICSVCAGMINIWYERKQKAIFNQFVMDFLRKQHLLRLQQQ